MIWLASFPRSGNTFFRNVLFEVYGIRSSTYHHEESYAVDEDYDQYQVVKTHLLPHQLIPNDPNIKAVYLVRDGRDALTSIAHHRQDMVAPESDFQVNLLEAIVSPKGSNFGGWSENVRQWTERADIVIRFTDLITDPIREIEKLRDIMDLPEPQLDKLPTFEQLKFGTPEYGSGKKYIADDSERQKHSSKSFRKGKVGGWKDEMTPKLESLFWEIHGETMTQMNYIKQKPKIKSASQQAKPYKVLIEANKLKMPGNDGIKRYQVELIENMKVLTEYFPNKWDIDLYFEGGNFMNLESIKISEFNEIVNEISHQEPYENLLLRFKNIINTILPAYIYNPLSSIYKALPFRKLLRLFKRKVSLKNLEQEILAYDEYDLIHVPLPQNFHYFHNVKGNFIATVHDLTHKIFPQFHTKDNIYLSEKGMTQAIEKNAHFLNISNATKTDLLDYYFNIQERNTSVIYEACNRNQFKPTSDLERLLKLRKKHQLPNGRYFLTLSTLEPRKNLVNTIKAFEKLLQETKEENLSLFICGKKGWKIEELFKNENIKNENIYFTGFVDESDLPVLFSNAIALCYASLYEGFGLPPIESMSCGTPVIYGNNSSMPEVIGDAGLAVNAEDINDIKEKMVRLLNQDIRKDLSSKSIKRAHQFSWLKTSWETLDLYENCILEKKN